MSGLLKTQLQLGDSATASNNFVLDSSAANGTMKLSRGNFGATTQDIVTIDSTGIVSILNKLVVPNATAANQAVNLGQLLTPIGGCSTVGGNNTTVTATVSFTAPGPGMLIAIGSKNISSQESSGHVSALYINGVQQMADSTLLPTTHMGFALTSGGAVNAQYTAAASVSFSCNVALYWIPTV
jgi:hypothetical protein